MADVDSNVVSYRLV